MSSGVESDEFPPSSHAHAHSSLTDEQASTHARTQDRLPHLQFPTWTFPSSRSPSLADPPRSATATIFSPQPRNQSSNSDPELVVPSHAHDRSHSTSHAGLFNNPNRSIFSSGPPTSSISSNTAQASMSSPPPPQPPHPLSALNNASGIPSKRSVHYQNSIPPSHRKSRISRAEKDIDDPSVTHERAPSADGRGISTPTALTRLFSGPEAPPIVSRNASYIRTHSGTAYTRASSNTAPLPNHLYNQGLLGGKHSDITVHAFGTSYALHRLLLDRAPFFASALSEPWFEASSKEMTLHPEEIDSNITQQAFELALKRIYGSHATSEEDKEAIGLFATGCWLEMPDLIDASVASILRQMSTAKLGSLIKLVTGNYYGKHGDRILGSAKAMLCREGWEMPLRYWDDVSGEIAREIIGGDGFFIPGEWERFVIAKKVLDRKLKIQAMDAGLFEPNGRPQRVPPDAMAFHAIRFDSVYRKTSFSGRVPEAYDQWLTLYTTPDIAPLLILLDEGIHYVHLSFEQLQKIREQRDILGLPLMSDKVINDALWMQMELRQKVVNAPELDLEIGLSRAAEESVDEVMADESNTRNGSHNKGKQRDTSNDGDDDDDVDMESGSWDGNGKPRKFWIPNIDSTSIMGGSLDTALYATPSTNRPYVSRLSASIDPVDVQWASDFTASANERPTVADRSEQNPQITYTHYPPFRFAAEFPNPRNLKEKKRVYSRTVWYAGSLWNVYIQKVETTKNTQLGVYLHRAKEKEAHEDHHRGSVDERIGQVEMLMRRNRHRRNSEEDISNSSADPDATLVPPEQTSRSTTLSNLLRGHPSGTSSEPSSLTKSSQTPTTPGTHTFSQHPLQGTNSDSDLDDPAFHNRESVKTQNSVPTIPAYVDGRPTIKTYFKIYSPSKGGRMLSVYESAPDLFNFSQSWGWKSSTMVLDDGLCGFDGVGEGAPAATGSRSKEGRLRFMVVIELAVETVISTPSLFLTTCIRLLTSIMT
ncbi:uncharacterized protein KY384_002617 [Bacidia gigantensis]|uniref:uncharacterized protein n=1 Tax=Bacidia gigantensis TaxID=2732470 RepID=UPI001D04D8DF|nr:uncharacterized protein KY384_002617 [Bacidia gigantensis]KAG8532740.1 hypothetical protein KY384_002617 [Bacidia gigantensis]